MQKYEGQLFRKFEDSTDGIAAANVQVTVRVKANNNLAILYSDPNGVDLITNPLTANENGYFGFYAQDGTYTIYAAGSTTPQFEAQLSSIGQIITPTPPTDIQIIASNFSLVAIPVLAGIDRSTEFEFAIGSVALIFARGQSAVFPGLLSGTEYTIYARTVNSLGVSAWYSETATTTANGSDIVNLIGGDIADQVFDDVVTEVNANLQAVVDASLVNYPNITEVNQIVTDSIAEITTAVPEDPRVILLEVIANKMANFETGADLHTETKERVTVTEQIQAKVNENTATITETKQVIAALDSSTATRFATLTTQVNNNASSLTSLQQTVTDLSSSTASDILALESQVGTNTAGLITINQTVVDLTSATASSLSQLQTRMTSAENGINGVAARVTTTEANIVSNASAIVTETDARTTQYNSLNSRLTTTESNATALTGRVATAESNITNNATAISTETNTRATQYNGLSTRLTTAENATTALASRVTTTEASIVTNANAISAESSARATQVNQLNAKTDTTNSSLSAQITRIDNVESSTNGNTNSINSLSGTVNNATTGLSATYTLANQAKTTADGAASSVSNVINTVNNPTTGLAATNTLATTAKTTADSAATAASTVTGTVNNATTGLAATYTLANTAKTTADGAATSATAVTNTVNNPSTGLSATNTLASLAKTTADGAATAASAVTGTVNNASTGLSATYTLANAAKTTADNALSSATTITNTVNNPSTGLSATATIANGAVTAAANAQSTANTALTATSGLQTQVNNVAGDLATANLTLTATVNGLGVVTSRAFLGVSSTSGGVTVSTGIVVDGAANALEFRSDVFRLSNVAGVVQLYWDSTRGKWVFNGDLVAATFQTATTGYRAEMSGAGSIPLWYGTGAKTWANANFAVDTSGNVKLNNVTATNFSATGGIVTGTGGDVRTEVINDGTYLVWIGSGAKTDANGLFWIKTNGIGFIKGQFFSGQIIESRMGSYTSGTIDGTTVSAAAHNSDGKPVEVTANCSVQLSIVGNTESSVMIINGNLRRNGVSIGNVQAAIAGYWDFETNVTMYTGGFTRVAVDNDATAGARTYDIIFSVPQFPSGFVNAAQTDITIKTFENKLQ